MRDLMFDAPDQEGLSAVVVSEDVINGTKRPEYHYIHLHSNQHFIAKKERLGNRSLFAILGNIQFGIFHIRYIE